MARHIYRGEVYEYYWWPLGIGTPHWFDNNLAEYRPRRSGWERIWSYLHAWHIIRSRHIPDAKNHLAGGVH